MKTSPKNTYRLRKQLRLTSSAPSHPRYMCRLSQEAAFGILESWRSNSLPAQTRYISNYSNPSGSSTFKAANTHDIRVIHFTLSSVLCYISRHSYTSAVWRPNWPSTPNPFRTCGKSRYVMTIVLKAGLSCLTRSFKATILATLNGTISPISIYIYIYQKHPKRQTDCTLAKKPRHLRSLGSNNPSQ